MYRRYSYSGGPPPPPHLPPPHPPPASPLPFPGSHPRHGPSPPHNGLPGMPGLTPTAASPSSSFTEEAAASASADEEQLQSVLSALRVALSKKEAALVGVAGRLAEAQARLDSSEAERRGLAVQVRDLQLAAGAAAPDQLLAQARQELGQEAAHAAELAAERNALQHDVAMLQQQLMVAAQAEAQERERLAAEATQGRLLARARARQVEQLQAELQQAADANSSAGAAASQHMAAAQADAAAAKAAAAEANARAAAVEEQAAQLRQQLEAAQQAKHEAEAKAAGLEAALAEAREQVEWQALRISELEQSSNVGQLLRKYEAEVQRLRAAFDADRRDLQQQLAAARQVAAAPAAGATPAAPPACEAATPPQQPSLDSSAWAALFEDATSQQAAPEVQDAGVQTEGSHQAPGEWVDPALLEAASQEVQRLQAVNAGLLESQMAAQQALNDALEQQRSAQLARDGEAAARQAAAAEHGLALDAALRAEAGLRERLGLAERQLAHRSGKVQALQEANEKLELGATALQEELGTARLVPQQQLQELQAELQRAAAHTSALEAQVQQLKQAAAAAAEQHAAALQQQAQEGALDAAEQVAQAVAAGAQRHNQQAQALQAQLDEARQQLQAAHTQLAELQEAEAKRQEGLTHQAVQASSTAAMQHAAVQTEPAFSSVHGTHMQQQHWKLGVSRASSSCESPHGSCGGRSPTPPPSVAQTAKQLQLELARVKLTPLKPLVGASLAVQRQQPSRLGSAYGELPAGGCVGLQRQRSGGWASGGSGLPPPPADVQGAAGLDCSGSGCGRQAAEDDDEYATPAASLSPATRSPAVALLGGEPAGLAAWQPQGGRSPHEQQAQQQAQAQAQQCGPPVPPLDLQRVPPYSSLSCDSSGREFAPAVPRSSSSSQGAGGSASVGSMSSLGPSASQLASSWSPSRGGGGSCGASELGRPGDGALGGSALGSSWQSAQLDASLARLAALTAGLTGKRR